MDGADIVAGQKKPAGDADSILRQSSELNLGAGQDSGPDGKSSLNPLCGQGRCNPDDVWDCAGGGGAGGGTSWEVGGAAGGVSFDPGNLADGSISCQVVSNQQCAGAQCGPLRSCLPSGVSNHGEPCAFSGDCAAGLACVGEGDSGVCRSYCCEGSAASCSEGSFCDERPLPESPQYYVPVCVPVDACPLSEPFPCAEGQDCTCPSGRSCTIVRPNGATGCTIPGAGQLGDACTEIDAGECAHGYVCSPSARACKKLCALSDETDCPEGRACQSDSKLPSSMGVCVGGDEAPLVAK